MSRGRSLVSKLSLGMKMLQRPRLDDVMPRIGLAPARDTALALALLWFRCHGIGLAHYFVFLALARDIIEPRSLYSQDTIL